ncbi:MAG: hypothetical protein JSV41_02525 [Gemmatimonadota bacterium]|nr:MAG: hypothetical protein JSV41_02525 [Gemmatimonadota bacterium]
MNRLGITTALVGAAILFAGCQDQTPTAPTDDAPVVSGPNAAVITQERDAPFEFTFDGCGEAVDAEGLDHWVVRQTLTPTGAWHFGFSNNWTATAEGQTTGNTWDARGSNNYFFIWDLTDGAPFTESWVRTSRFIGHGSAPDFILQGRDHVTVNANGDFTVYSTVDKIICH